MALNWVTIVDAKPLILQGESSIDTIDGVKYNLTIPSTPSSAGVSGRLKKVEGVGTISLTDQRLIWINSDAASSFKSLTIPLPSILSSKFEQPIFGANHLTIGVKPTPDGGLAEGTLLEIRFVNTGMFRFVNILEKTRERAIFMKRQLLEDEEHLPEYTTSAGTSSAGGGLAPYSDLPPGYDG